MNNESEVVFVEETRQSKSFEATIEEILKKFRSGEIKGDRVVRRTIDGEYSWLNVADLSKNERDVQSVSDSKTIEPQKPEQKPESGWNNPIVFGLIGVLIGSIAGAIFEPEGVNIIGGTAIIGGNIGYIAYILFRRANDNAK